MAKIQYIDKNLEIKEIDVNISGYCLEQYTNGEWQFALIHGNNEILNESNNEYYCDYKYKNKTLRMLNNNFWDQFDNKN